MAVRQTGGLFDGTPWKRQVWEVDANTTLVGAPLTPEELLEDLFISVNEPIKSHPPDHRAAVRVIDASTGEGIPGASVYLIAGMDGWRAPGSSATLTGESGMAEYPSIVYWDGYYVEASADGFAPMREPLSQVPMGEPMSETVVKLAPGVAVRGVVIDGNGTPVSDGWVEISYRVGEMSYKNRWVMQTTKDGAFEFPCPTGYVVSITVGAVGYSESHWEGEAGSLVRIRLERARCAR